MEIESVDPSESWESAAGLLHAVFQKAATYMVRAIKT
jgi:hypothetical protein